LAVAIAAAVAFGAALLMSDRPLDDTVTIRAIAIPTGLAFATMNIVSLRWVTDRMKGTAYGEIIRVRDKDESEVSLPYRIVIAAGFLTTAIGVFAVIIQGELQRQWDALLLTALLFFGVYSLLGTASLIRLTLFHQRQSSKLQSAQEQLARDLRQEEQRRKHGDGDV
jgi:hypothetical protein